MFKKVFNVLLSMFLAFSMLISISIPSFAFEEANEVFSGNDLSEDYVDDSNENLYKILNDNIGNNMLRTASLSTPVSNTYVDLAFVIDTTGSMSPYIKNVKDNVTDFAKYLEDKGINLRVAIVEYRDTTSDGINSTIVHKWNGSTWHTKTTDMVTTLTKLSANGGGDEPETAIDGLGYLVDDANTLLWSSKAFKFAVLLTDASPKTNNRHGISSMSQMADLLAEKNINTSVITTASCKSYYDVLINRTGGIYANINSSNFSNELKALADKIIGITSGKKAIYVLPGYMGSKLYYNGNELWMDSDALKSDIEKFFVVFGEDTKLKLNSDGSGSQVEADMEKDNYGTFDTYQSMMQKLEGEFSSEYDVIFFPYNWLGDLNDSVIELENHIAENEYDQVVFVTHSTGGLLASAYIAKDNNKAKVLKNILIAPPLFGTYTALQPIETGKVNDIEDMLKNNNINDDSVLLFWNQYNIIYDWIKYVTHNSPTTYQLLPSIEYLKLMPVMYEDYFEGGNAILTKDAYYSLINKSGNINSNLTNGNDRSHKYFRDTSLKDDIVGVLQEVDTLLIGSSYGNLTPALARYTTTDYILWQTTECTDFTMKLDGDGTVLNVSAFATETADEHILPYQDFKNVSHGGLVNVNSHPEVMQYVCDNIPKAKSGVSASNMSLTSFNSADNSLITDEVLSMSDYIKINVNTNKNAHIQIRDLKGNLVASIQEESSIFTFDGIDYPITGMVASGFDGKLLSYTPSSSSSEGLTGVIYMPKSGYMIDVTYGNEANKSINFGFIVSTLTDKGDLSASAVYATTTTSANGLVFSLNLADVNTSNIGDLCENNSILLKTEYFLTDWSIPTEIKLKTIGESQDIVISGGDADSVLLKWYSSDESVVSVSANGKISANGYGKAVVVASDGNITTTCKVTVERYTASIEINDISMLLGERTLIKPIFDSESVTETDVEYSYDSSLDIISIDQYGVILASSTGTIEVTATAPGGVSTVFKVIVTLNGIVSVDSVSLSSSELDIKKGKSAELNAIINPTNAENQKVVWELSNPSVASITTDGLNCVITGLKEGFTTVTVITNDGGYTAIANVYITNGLSKESIQIQSMDVNANNPINNTIAVRIKVANISDQNINLSDLKLQYIYNNDSNENEIFECDWASNNHIGIRDLVFGTIKYSDEINNSIIEISFADVGQILAPNETLEIHFRVHTQNWDLYDLANDYSLGTTDFSVTEKVLLYFENTLIYGEYTS